MQKYLWEVARRLLVSVDRVTLWRRVMAVFGGAALLLMLASPVVGSLAIEPGRESEIAALFAPYQLGAEVTPGWRFMQLGIHPNHIFAGLETAAGAGGPIASFRLDHPMRAPAGTERTPSFAVLRDIDGGLPEDAMLAVDRLVSAVRTNDDGRFWRGRPPVGARANPLAAMASAAVFDGLVLLLVAVLTLGLLVGEQLRRSDPRVGLALAAVVVAGAVIRWLLAQQVALGVWPYTRVLRIAQLAFDGPILAWFTEQTGARLYYTDLTFALNFFIAVITPLAIFAHGFYVLRDPLAALAAAALIAFLPSHIRFSRSEVEFIPSIALTSLCFALLHAGLSAPGRRWRWMAIAALPCFVFASIVTRELNILMAPLLVLAVLLLRPDSARRGEVAAVLIGIAAAGAAGYFLHLVPNYSENIADGLRPGTLFNGVHAFFSRRYNTLANAAITPPLIVWLAVTGSVVLFRRGEPRHAVFLLAWFVFYFGAHSYVLPEEPLMQARYHLHLAPPLVFLAAPAAAALFAWRPATRWALVAALAALPALHSGFIRDVDFNDMREFRFLQEVRHLIPDGCVALEYPGVFAHDRRLPRIGMVLDAGRPDMRWRTEVAGVLGPGDPLSSAARGLFANPPPCLYWFEGIPCWNGKSPEQPIAPTCAAVRDALVLEPVRTQTFLSRIYDENLSVGFGPAAPTLTLGLYRVRGNIRQVR